MHNPALERLGLDWRYLAFEVPPELLRPALDGARAMGFIGLNLTIPHKLLAVGMMDELDDSAKRWGAVNTVRFEVRDAGGQSVPLGRTETPPRGAIIARGFNTDADAIVRAIAEDLDLRNLEGRSVLLLGAGGAGRVAALRLAQAAVKSLLLINRTPAKAQTLADEIRARFQAVAVSTDYPASRVDLVVNATSLGLKPDDPLPYDPTRFDLRHAGAVFDMVYRPATTPLLTAARQAGCRVANGLGMLLHQGAAALEIWSGLTPPIDLMREALHRHVYGEPDDAGGSNAGASNR